MTDASPGRVIGIDERDHPRRPEHGITADVEMIDIKDVNDAFDKMVANEVRLRYVIENSTLPAVAG